MARIVEIGFGNNVDCEGGLVVNVENGYVEVWFEGGCWSRDEVLVTITKNRVVANVNGDVKEYEW